MKALAGAVLAAAITSCAFAAIPEWAKAAAEAAPPLPDGMPEWPERTLLAETRIVVSADGATWQIQRRKVVQVLSNRVEDTAFGFFAFDDTTKIKKSKGWHVPPGERAQRDFGGALDLGLSSDFLTDAKARVVALGGVKKGSLVVYEFDAESRPYTLTAVESFYDDVPVSLARWSITLPPAWTLKYAWLPASGPEPTRSGSAWVFEQHDLTPERGEPMGERPSDLGPRLMVALQPPDGATTTTPAFSDWDGLARWYRDLARDRETATPEIQAAAKNALAKAGPAPLDRIRAMSMFVRDRVRYLAREVGVGGYQPRAGSQVLAGLYGDCKDKGTLLRAMLQASGFDSYPILIHASNPYTVAPDVPLPGSFNHFVIGVVWPKDAPFPEEAASAKVDAGDAGTILVVDPTDERAWPGTLPESLAGKTALVVTGGRGLLLVLPEASSKWHRITRKTTVAISQDHAVSIQIVSRLYGGPAEEARDAHATSYKDRRERVEADYRNVWPGCETTAYEVTPEDTDGAYVETVALAIPAGATRHQENAFWMFGAATRDIERVPLGKRKTAVVYLHPLEIRYEALVTGAAATNSIPAATKLSGGAWSVETTFDRAGEAIHGVWKADLSQAFFAPSAFADLKQFWSAASKAASPELRME